MDKILKKFQEILTNSITISNKFREIFSKFISDFLFWDFMRNPGKLKIWEVIRKILEKFRKISNLENSKNFQLAIFQ